MSPTTALVPESPADRPEFSTVELTIDPDAAAAVIDSTLAGLPSTATVEGRRFRTTDGMLVAVLTHGEQPSGPVESRLSYRTAPAAELATRKARRLRLALRPYEV